MKIAIIGSTHPYKGGIAQHTTALAHQLKSAGHNVQLISWRHQYPFFYPGQQFVPDNRPELPVFDATKRVLSWRNPLTWIAQARRLKTFDKLILVWWAPTIQGPVYYLMLKLIGRSGPNKIILCHNVIQHHPSPVDRYLATRVFNMSDKLVVHTEAQKQLANNLTSTSVAVATLPAYMTLQPASRPKPYQAQNRLLFFGLVRPYKGVDILTQALALVPNIKLIVAGEFWGKQLPSLKKLVSDLDLTSRVDLRDGYVPNVKLAKLFIEADALVMPYRSGTATQNVDLAFAHGLPVIATKVGSMASKINDNVDGLLCLPDDIESLKNAIEHFYHPGVAERLHKQMPKNDSNADWQKYISAIVA